ncbi:RNA-guided endonuclease InsQ/TnpB family protein [Streptomyces zhihengii]|uniref:RNA-guided endonuclease InsQ/TnpB family protein n=1 Tax=Streptomyces zhihengii TaxID=1818004 RepID=UPI00363C78CA
MKIVTQVKLTPSPEVAAVLESTLHTVNEHANRVSVLAFERRVFRNYDLRKIAYAEVREAGIGSQAAQHLIKKVADGYATLKANLKAGNYGKPGSKRRVTVESKPITFRPDAAQPYDQRNMSFDLDAQTVSLWTLSGRIKNIPFACSAEALKNLAGKRGEADLLRRAGVWFLVVTLDVPEAAQYEPDGFIGVDLGIENIATTSTGYLAAGRKLNRYRKRQLDLRRKLQAKGTKSAKRLLKKRSRKESRRTRDINHCISKTIVTEAKRTGRGIALEDLTGIRARVRHRKPQRVTLHSWAFAQLGQFLVYKAQRDGVPLVYVDAAYTSQMCCECGHADRKNRVDQGRFICRGCGVVAHADRNASHNIARRGVTVWNEGRQSPVPATTTPR